MKPRIIHVTDHAALRWRQRIANAELCNVHDIIDSVRKSKVLRKTDVLPFMYVRHPNTVYTYKDETLFIMEPMEIDEYRLVTVITKTDNYIPRQPRAKKKTTPSSEPEKRSKKIRRKTPVRKKRITLDEEP